MIALLLWACGGHGDETPDQPIPGEAVIADSVKWRLHDGGVVRFLEHRGEPALAVSVPNHTTGSAYNPDTTPLSDAPIVMILAPPFVGGSLLEVADASVSDDQQVIAMDAADWTSTSARS